MPMQMKNVLITGGSGFLGRGLALALKAAHNVVLASEDRELNRLAEESTGCPARVVDVTDIHSLRTAFAETRPEIVIHAAARKSVPEAEKRPLECTDVNVIGSQNVARVAMENDCSMVVGISSTRAAPPTGDTYGLTKAIMERMFCSLNGKTATRFAAVRLGNIAWAAGSVLPAWQQMLDESGVIKSTGPEMRRFFLTNGEAVHLVLACIDRIEEFQGRVLARRIKQAQVKDILLKFVELKGGTWEQSEGRRGDKADEMLIGELELPYCREVMFDGSTHYVLGFNDKAAKPMTEAISTANVEPLSTEEIVRLITDSPTALARDGGAA